MACHRISSKSPSVLIKFLNTKDAEALLNSKSAIDSLDKSEIGIDANDRLYVDQHLTPYMGKLAYLCRCAKRQKLILNTKTEKGAIKILVNHDDAFHWFIVSHVNDLLKWAPNLNTED